MNEEKSDHEVDMEFGQWLRDQRAKTKLTMEEAAQRAGLLPERLKSLELGYAEKGITQQEAQKLCSAYRIDIKELLDKATGNT